MVEIIIICIILTCITLIGAKIYTDMGRELKEYKLMLEHFKEWSENVNFELEKTQAELEVGKKVLEQYGTTLKDNMPVILKEKNTQQELFEEWVYGEVKNK